MLPGVEACPSFIYLFCFVSFSEIVCESTDPWESTHLPPSPGVDCSLQSHCEVHLKKMQKANRPHDSARRLNLALLQQAVNTGLNLIKVHILKNSQNPYVTSYKLVNLNEVSTKITFSLLQTLSCLSGTFGSGDTGTVSATSSRA